ncbi:MAG: hypothetical protein HYT78_17070 [Deltaproteobacteria bacterium]|nr:hypothetical protein [Deltaproteobacteria bacterium]
MKKIVGVLLVSLTLLGPAHFALAASDDEKVLMRLEKLEKQIQLLQTTIKVRMMEGKMMSGKQMKDTMKRMEMVERELDNVYRGD